MTYFFRLQEKNIGEKEMSNWTSDYVSECSPDEVGEEFEKFEGTICATDSPWDTNFGGAIGDEVVVVTGRVAFRIYDGVRLVSATIKVVARYDYETWRCLVNSGDDEIIGWDE